MPKKKPRRIHFYTGVFGVTACGKRARISKGVPNYYHDWDFVNCPECIEVRKGMRVNMIGGKGGWR